MDNKHNNLNKLLHATGMWRASSIDDGSYATIPTGFTLLDSTLPGNGWPAQGLTELLYERPGIGELRLLGPGLAHLSQQDSRKILWINPPFIPYAPGLAALGIQLHNILVVRPDTPLDALWVAEKALGSEGCSAVLLWPRTIEPRDIRRLQVAGKAGNCLGVLFRPASAAGQASAAELRIKLTPDNQIDLQDQTELRLQILKRRGGWATSLKLSLQDDLNRRTPYFPELSIPLQSPTLPQGHQIPAISSWPEGIHVQ